MNCYTRLLYFTINTSHPKCRHLIALDNTKKQTQECFKITQANANKTKPRLSMGVNYCVIKPRSWRILSAFSSSSRCLFWASMTSVDVLHAAYKLRTSRLMSKNVLPHLNFDNSSSPRSCSPTHIDQSTDCLQLHVSLR